MFAKWGLLLIIGVASIVRAQDDNSIDDSVTDDDKKRELLRWFPADSDEDCEEQPGAEQVGKAKHLYWGPLKGQSFQRFVRANPASPVEKMRRDFVSAAELEIQPRSPTVGSFCAEHARFHLNSTGRRLIQLKTTVSRPEM